jgi:hypothetical protein
MRRRTASCSGTRPALASEEGRSSPAARSADASWHTRAPAARTCKLPGLLAMSAFQSSPAAPSRPSGPSAAATSPSPKFRSASVARICSAARQHRQRGQTDRGCQQQGGTSRWQAARASAALLARRGGPLPGSPHTRQRPSGPPGVTPSCRTNSSRLASDQPRVAATNSARLICA